MSAIMRIEGGDINTPEKRERYVISVVGCGRMGLPTACLFAEAGFRVIGVEVNRRVINLIKRGKTPFPEPGLEALIKKHVQTGRFVITNDAKEAASRSSVIVLVLPTPIDEKRRPNYLYIERACEALGIGLRSGSLVISESTVGPGITESIVGYTLERMSGLRVGVDFGLAYSPIRAASGRVLRDIATYPRIVGAVDKQSLKVASLILSTIVKGGIIKVRDIKTAETIKLFENVYRDINIALANELARYCERAGIDFLEVQKAANTQPYCHLLIPGIVSGHIPKDPYLLVEEAENLGMKLRMVLLGRKINDGMVAHAVRLTKSALRACRKTLRRSKISVLGVSYRPNVKETRGSMVKDLVEMLTQRGASIHVYDPLFSLKELEELGYPAKRTITGAVRGADCILIAVGHDQFKRLNLKRIKLLIRSPAAIVDFGHVVDPVRAESEGFVYRGVGRGVWTH